MKLKTKKQLTFIWVKSLIIASLVWFLFAGCQTENLEPEILQAADKTEAETGNTFLTDIGDYYLYGGDMLLDKSDENHQAIIEVLKSGEVSADSRLATKSSFKKWPRGLVKYYFSGSWTTTEKNIVRGAMQAYTDAANILFYETEERGSYILKMEKVPDDDVYAGHSTVGYVSAPVIGITSSYVQSHIIMHELGHTLSFDHEHQRPDRDSYITVQTNNLHMENTTVANAFAKVSFNSLHTTYDVRSILHYKPYSESDSVAIDITKPVIVGKNVTLVENKVLSNLDKQGLVNMYGAKQTTYFSGIFEKRSEGDIVIKNFKRNDFLSRVNQYASSGYRLHDFDVYIVNGADLYFGVFRKSTAAESYMIGFTRQDFINYYNTMRSQGWRIHKMRSYYLNGKDYYCAFFRKSSTDETWVLGWKRSDFISKYYDMKYSGWLVHEMDVYVINGEEYYGAFFRKSTASETEVFSYSESKFGAKVSSLKESGWKVRRMTVFAKNGAPYYTATFRKNSVDELGLFGFRSEDFDYEHNILRSQGFYIKTLGAFDLK